jgi:hypothetical protein
MNAQILLKISYYSAQFLTFCDTPLFLLLIHKFHGTRAALVGLSICRPLLGPSVPFAPSAHHAARHTSRSPPGNHSHLESSRARKYEKRRGHGRTDRPASVRRLGAVGECADLCGPCRAKPRGAARQALEGRPAQLLDPQPPCLYPTTVAAATHRTAARTRTCVCERGRESERASEREGGSTPHHATHTHRERDRHIDGRTRE